MRRALLVFVLGWSVAGLAVAAPLTVGIEGRLEVSLPIAGLKARAPERAAPVTVRIAGVKEGEAGTTYDLRFIGLVPGRYDLRPYLLKPDGEAATKLPPLEVQVDGILPPDQKGRLIAIPQGSIEAVGGYQWVLVGAGVLWLLAAIPIFRRRRVAARRVAEPGQVRLTLPERLRALVMQAAAGKLDVAGKAELERMVLSHWSEELKLQTLPPAEVMARLRAHPQAEALLRSLEGWLHRRPNGEEVDLEALLAEYGPVPGNPKEAAVR